MYLVSANTTHLHASSQQTFNTQTPTNTLGSLFDFSKAFPTPAVVGAPRVETFLGFFVAYQWIQTFVYVYGVGVAWCGMVWHGVAWCGMVWHGVAWCGMVWHSVAWCGMVWHGVAWCGMVWHGVAWCGMVWHDVAWCGMMWHGVAWCGMVWHGVTWLWHGVTWLWHGWGTNILITKIIKLKLID